MEDAPNETPKPSRVGVEDVPGPHRVRQLMAMPDVG